MTPTLKWRRQNNIRNGDYVGNTSVNFCVESISNTPCMCIWNTFYTKLYCDSIYTRFYGFRVGFYKMRGPTIETSKKFLIVFIYVRYKNWFGSTINNSLKYSTETENDSFVALGPLNPGENIYYNKIFRRIFKQRTTNAFIVSAHVQILLQKNKVSARLPVKAQRDIAL